ncbi:MAG TPA: hypothetical protein DD740_06045 [Chryseobacterium sp.]|nr:hypothetical protein [Chryseobacterium sp.]
MVRLFWTKIKSIAVKIKIKFNKCLFLIKVEDIFYLYLCRSCNNGWNYNRFCRFIIKNPENQKNLREL